MYRSWRRSEEASDPRMELQAVVSSHVGAGNPGPLHKQPPQALDEVFIFIRP